MLIGGLGTPELIIILIVVLLLFGGKKIPELMKAMGQGVKSFKDGVNGIGDTVDKATDNDNSQPSDGSCPKDNKTDSNAVTR